MNTNIARSTDGTPQAWLITGISFLVMGATWGAQGAFGAFVTPLTEQMGWSRTEVSVAFSILTIINFVIGVAWGLAADRWGAKWVIVVSGVIMGLGVFLTGTSTAVWHLYVYYGLIAGIGLGGLVGPVSAIIARWFDRRRGLALAICYAGMGSGVAGLPVLAEHLSSTFGWRMGFWGLGAIIWAAILLSAVILRDPRRNEGSTSLVDIEENTNLSTPGAPAEDGKSRGHQFSMSLKGASRQATFWIMVGMELCATLIFFMVLVHLAARATDTGVALGTAVVLITVIGLVNMVSQIIGGVLGDKFGPRMIFGVGMVICTLAVVWLLFSSTLVMMFIFAAVFGLGTGIWSPQMPSMIARTFGTGHLAAIWGAVLIGAGIGGLIGPTLAGFIFDKTGAYTIAFSIGAVVSAIGVLLAFWLSDEPLYNNPEEYCGDGT